MITGMLNNSGWHVDHKPPKRRVTVRLREDREDATGPNDVRAMDLVHDQLALGKKLRILTVVDPRFRYRGEDVVKTLEAVCARVGHPTTTRVDTGSEFICRDLDLRASAHDVTLDVSRPGKPTDNGVMEAFSSKLRAEWLNARRHCLSNHVWMAPWQELCSGLASWLVAAMYSASDVQRFCSCAP